MKRALIWIGGAASLLAGCGAAWTDSERSTFRDDCMTNVRIEAESLRAAICDCTLERTSAVYSYADVVGGGPKVNDAFVEIIKQCSREHNVRAHVPEAPK